MQVLATMALVGTLGLGAVVAGLLCTPVPISSWIADPVTSYQLAQGKNPAPVQMVLPKILPLSAYAQLGKLIFFDPSLSASGQLACASCHSPGHFYGPPGDLPAMYGGPTLASQGVRAVPSLMYLQNPSDFSIGPDPGDDTAMPPPIPTAMATSAIKTAQSTAQSAENMVPQGGLFWDGRVNTLQDQAMGPLLNPFEMDGGSAQRLTAKLQAAPYARRFIQLDGPDIFTSPALTMSEAVLALARYQVEDPSFHPYSSKYDAWLEGRTRLSRTEMRGYILFNDPAKGDCAACHLDQPTPQGQPPLFTDQQFEALGVPRNPELNVNQNPAYFDLGLCGPYRTDLAAQTQYCGMFLTPTLRNAASRQLFFHNGIYHDLQHVLDFYNFRDTRPAKIYPASAGQVAKFDDLPQSDWPNIDTADPPFDRQFGQSPPLTNGEEADIIAFLKTLIDGNPP